MKKILLVYVFVFLGHSLFAQDAPHPDYPLWPADKPETVRIAQSQSRESRLEDLLLPQEIAMQDRMRTLFTDMMQHAAKKLGWQMVELSEYTNEGGLQGAGTPYNLRSPRGINITFLFVVNKDNLKAWKQYQINYNNKHLNTQSNTYNSQMDVTNSPLYKRYKDSMEHYQNLYLNYVNAHQSEGAALYTKDKHPKYYQDKENEFIEKMTNMTQQVQDNAGIDEMENENKLQTFNFRNETIVQVHFHVNAFASGPQEQSIQGSEYNSSSYPMPPALLSRIYAFKLITSNETPDKWKNVLLVLLGNFHTRPNEEGYFDAGFNYTTQGDEHTPKKIKSDKIQNISITISGNKMNVERMAKLIDVEKLNREIVKQ